MTGTKFFAEAVATPLDRCGVEERSAQGEAKALAAVDKAEVRMSA